MYLTIISAGERNWGALVPELHCIVTAPSRNELIRLSQESIALALEDQHGHQPAVKSLEDLDLELRADLDGSEEVIFLGPAPMNPVSLELERALASAGLSKSELARRIGSSPAAVHRLLNPFYWGHSVSVLRRVAEALDTELRVTFTARAS